MMHKHITRRTRWASFLFLIAIVPVVSSQVPSPNQTGTIIVYRLRGKNFGLIHYSEGEHPTIFCNDIKIARISENRRAIINVGAGTYSCEARQHPPTTMDASSQPVSVTINPGETAYLRLEIEFGHLHFVLHQVSTEIGKSEIEKTRTAEASNIYTSAILTHNQQDKPLNKASE